MPLLASAITLVLTARPSPACMISFFVTAFAKGDFAQAWAWSDEPEKAKDEDDKAGTVSAAADQAHGTEKAASADAAGTITEEPRKKLKKRR